LISSWTSNRGDAVDRLGLGRRSRARSWRNQLSIPAAVVADGVGDIEERTETPLGRPRCIEDAQLVHIRVDADVWRVLLTDDQETDRLVAAVLVAVGSVLAARKSGDLAVR
jgi:hypothetical protein